ncbi:MAG: HNH endonuclease [Acidimicrobiales bacterium]
MPPIRPGASGGPTAGRPFPSSVREASVADNLATTGADAPTCVWCRMETPRPHIDHATPRSLGDNATVDNAQVSCPHCNMSRGNRPTPVNPPPGYEGPWPPPWWPQNL